MIITAATSKTAIRIQIHRLLLADVPGRSSDPALSPCSNVAWDGPGASVCSVAGFDASEAVGALVEAVVSSVAVSEGAVVASGAVVAVGTGVLVGTGVKVAAGLFVGTGVAVGVLVGIGVAVTAGAAVGTGVAVGAAVGVGVAEGIGVGVAVGVGVVSMTDFSTTPVDVASTSSPEAYWSAAHVTDTFVISVS